jgi:protease II
LKGVISTPAALAAIRARAGANIALKTDMGAGHFSLSDRYLYLREKAFAYAFVLDSLGVQA